MNEENHGTVPVLYDYKTKHLNISKTMYHVLTLNNH